MKIFVIEDEKASIESAKMQLGVDHELVFFTTAMEVIERLFKQMAIENQGPDLILTDVNIPMGDPDCYSVKEHYSPNDMIPAGLVVALKAAVVRVPCLILSDSNSHRDMIGFLLDATQFPRTTGAPQMVKSWTRPDRVETSIGEGKDWLGVITYFGGIEKLIERLTTVKGKSSI